MVFRANQSAAARAAFLSALLVFCLAYSEVCATIESIVAMIDVGTDANGSTPAEFELQGQWTAVRDPTAINGVALQSSGVPPFEHQLPLAIYKAALLKNGRRK
jgi:hypothetical protein